MGIHFKAFCDRQRKLRNGHVRDVIDMDDMAKDQAVMALLRDEGQSSLADLYPQLSEAGKNSSYQSVEWIIRDCIEKYNLGVDIQREQPLCDDEKVCV